MNKLLISTALAGLLAATGTVFAQDDHRGRGDHPPGPPPAAAPQAARGPAPAAHHDDHRGPPPAAAPARAAPPAGRPDDRRSNGPGPGAPASRPDDRRFNGPRPGANAPGPGAPAFNQGNSGPRFSGSNRNAGPRPDFSAMRRNFSASRRFRAPAYRPPGGWYAHRWTYGEILPSLFWAPDYWIGDFYDYGLAPPPPGTVWVRDGDDALLIDRYSGEIIQVDYGVFY